VIDLRYIAQELLKLRKLPKADPEQLIPIPCRCDPPRQHGPHWVAARRLQKGGDLRGKVKLPAGALEALDGQ